MADSFRKYTRYVRNSGATSVVFGNGKPVLEVEMNEIQEMQKNALREHTRAFIGNGVSSHECFKMKNDGVHLGFGIGGIFSVDGYVVNTDYTYPYVAKFPYATVSGVGKGPVSSDVTKYYSVRTSYRGYVPKGYSITSATILYYICTKQEAEDNYDAILNGMVVEESERYPGVKAYLSNISQSDPYVMARYFDISIGLDLAIFIRPVLLYDCPDGSKGYTYCNTVMITEELIADLNNEEVTSWFAFVKYGNLLDMTNVNVGDKIYLKVFEEDYSYGEVSPSLGNLSVGNTKVFFADYVQDIRVKEETTKRKVLCFIGTNERDYKDTKYHYLELGECVSDPLIACGKNIKMTCPEIPTLSEFVGYYKPQLDISREVLFNLFQKYTYDGSYEAVYYGLPETILINTDATVSNGRFVRIPSGTIIYVQESNFVDSSGDSIEMCKKFLIAENDENIPCYHAVSPAGTSKDMFLCIRKDAFHIYGEPFAPLNRETCFLMDSSMNYSGAPVPDYHFKFNIGVNSIVNSMVQNFIPFEGLNMGRGVPAHTHDYADIDHTPAEYKHPTTPGNKHIPSGGSYGQYLGYASNGTAKWVTPGQPSYWIRTSDFYSYPISLREMVDFLTVDNDIKQAIHVTDTRGGEILQLSLFISGTFTYKDGTVIIPFMAYLKASSCSIDGAESYGTFIIYDEIEPLAHVRLFLNANNKNNITAVTGMVHAASEFVQNDATLEIYDCLYSSDIW